MQEKRAWLQGLGAGLILAAVIFYLSVLTTGQTSSRQGIDIYTLPDSQVIERAKELGMVMLTDGFQEK